MHINKEIDIDIFIHALKKSWYWMVLVFCIFLGAGFIYLRYTKPVFESNSTIQIVEKDEGQKIVEIENVNTQNSELQQELELLRSELLLSKTLKKLNLNVGYFSKGKILTEEKYTNSSFQIQPIEVPDSIFNGVKIWLTKSDNDFRINYSFLGEEFEEKVVEDELFKTPHFSAYFRINNKESLLSEIDVNELYFQFNNIERLTSRYLTTLRVDIANSEAKTINISYQSNNARLAKDLVEMHTKVFFDFDEESKHKTSSDILGFIKKQLDSVRKELVLSEDTLKNFKQVNRENLAHQPAVDVYGKIKELQQKLVKVELEEDLLREVESTIIINDSRLDIYKLIATVVGSKFETSLGEQLRELHKLMLEQENLLFSRTEDNSKVKKVSQEIITIKSSIQNIIKALRSRMISERNVLLVEKAKLDKNFIQLPEKEMGLTRLRRMYSLNEKYYMLLLEKKTQYSISDKGFHSTNLILKAPIVTNVPISPKPLVIYGAGIVFAIVVGLLILILKYLFFNEVQSFEELKKVLNPSIGLLGIVPKYKKKIPNSQIVVHLSPKSIISENFRNIRTNIQFLNQKGKGTIAISSSISGEGKTFVALNLAGIIALSGKKTVLVDLDLRKPKVHLGFQVDNSKGMSTVLSGNEKLENCINHSEVEGLDFITAGPIPPNPSELIINNRIEEIIKQLEGMYDQVIIDNPPIGLISDGLHIFNMVDIPIYIFRANYSKRNFSTRINDLVEEGKIKNLSVILNGFTSKRKGYGYGYGYGYGNYYEED